MDNMIKPFRLCWVKSVLDFNVLSTAWGHLRTKEEEDFVEKLVTFQCKVVFIFD